MSAKRDKIIKDIEKAEQIIMEWQVKLKALQKEKIDLDNLEMIDYLKKNKVDRADLIKIVDILNETNGGIIPLKTEIMEEKESEKNQII